MAQKKVTTQAQRAASKSKNANSGVNKNSKTSQTEEQKFQFPPGLLVL
jgi:hypothetical protein